MREYAKISPQFWIGDTGRKIKALGLEAQLIALYLLTCPHANMLGIYYLPITFITHETGIPFEGACKALQSLSEVSFCTYDERMEYVWVHEMASYQIGGQLKVNDNRVKGINDIFHNLPKTRFLSAFFEKYKTTFRLEKVSESSDLQEAPSKGLRSQEQEQEQEKEKEKEQEKKLSLSGKPDVDCQKEEMIFQPQQKSSTLLFKNQATDILHFLNKKTGKAYRPVDANIKLIITRLKSGATVDQCRQVIAKKTREWTTDPHMQVYLRPATLFNATKFEQYLGELVQPTTGENDHA